MRNLLLTFLSVIALSAIFTSPRHLSAEGPVAEPQNDPAAMAIEDCLSILRLSGLKAGACSGLTLRGASFPVPKGRAWAPSNGSKKSPVAGVSLHSLPHMTTFYKARGFSPLWTNGGKPSKGARDLIEFIGAIGLEGLRPEFYHKREIDEIMQDDTRSAELDILLTDAFFTLCSNLSNGLVNPFNFKTRWFEPRADTDLAWILNNAITTDTVVPSLDKLKPTSNRYRMLRDSLLGFRKSASDGGWPKVPDLPKMQKDEKMQIGKRDPFVIPLRRRLEVTEGLKRGPPEADDLFDEDVDRAVKGFQSKNGLNEDGVVGKLTVDAMNVSADELVCQIIINLDRHRALGKEMSADKYITVNIPAFRVDVVEGGRSVLDMRAIVGRYSDKSPLMADEMEFIIFAPKWHVPESIALKEELGKLKEDPEKFRRRGMRVYHGKGRDRVELDYTSYDWSQVTVDNFEYRFVQDPGYGNALGKIKFLFPNKDDVYLHDTPTKPLFQKDVRMFSHGCIRIEKPVEMAEYLLRSTGKWDRERIEKESHRGSELMVTLPEKVPVYLVYITAWVDDSGKTQFRKDVYNYDSRLKKLFCE